MSIDKYLAELARATAGGVSADLVAGMNPLETPQELADDKLSTLQQNSQAKLDRLSKIQPTITNEDVYRRGMEQRFDTLGRLNTQGLDLLSQTMNADMKGNIFGMDKPLNMPVELASDGQLDYSGNREMGNLRGVGGQDLYSIMNTPTEDTDYANTRYPDKPIQGAFQPATLTKIEDADTFELANRDKDIRLNGVDAYEIDHGDMSYYQTPKGQEKLARQRQSLAVETGQQAYNVDPSTSFTNLKQALRTRESGGNYGIVNDYGYIGAYQFGAARLADLGMVKPGTTNKQLGDPSVWTGKHGIKSQGQFLQNPEVQDAVMDEHINEYAKRLSSESTSMEDLTGKIAAAHLLGVEGAKNLDGVDANKTSGREYYELGRLAGSDQIQPEYYARGTGKTSKEIAKADKADGYLGELLDTAQGSIAKFAADVYNMAEKLVGKENIDKYNKWASSVEKALGGDGDVGVLIDDTGTIKGTGVNIQDFRDREFAAKEFGVSQDTIDEHNAKMAVGLEDWKKADTVTDHIKVMANMVSSIPQILSESSGEIAGLMLPGGIAAVAATRTSNYAEEFKKNNGYDMPLDKLVTTFLGEAAVVMPEKLLLTSGVAKAFKALTTGGRAKSIVTAGAGEGVQEWLEGITEQYATQKEGAKTLGEIATAPEQTFGAALGLVTGGGLASTGIVRDAVPAAINAGKRGIELATENELQKQQRIDREFVTPKRQEAVNAVFNGDVNTVIKNAEAMHGKLTESVDANAPKVYTYSSVIKDALAVATKSNNPEAVNKVYEMIAKLDQSDAEFSAKDILAEEDEILADEFIKAINNPEIKGKLAESIGARTDSNLAEIQKLQQIAIERRERNKKFGINVRGSGPIDTVEGPDLNQMVIDLAEAYLKDGKTLDNVNKEFAEVGFIVKDGTGAGMKADPNRPGINKYKTTLSRMLNDTKVQNKLLDPKMDHAWGIPTFSKLKEFADSRVKKLEPGKYQTSSLISELLDENRQMEEVASQLAAQVENAAGITTANKEAYLDVLNTVKMSANKATNELSRRQSILAQLPSDVANKAEFHVDKNSGEETIQVTAGKKDANDNWIKNTIAKIGKNNEIIYSPDYVAKVAEAVEVTDDTQVATKAKIEPSKEAMRVEAQEPEVETYVPSNRSIIDRTPSKEKNEEKAAIEAMERAEAAALAKVQEPEVNTKSTPAKEGPLKAIREKIAELDKELADRIKAIPDMNVKQHVKDHYNAKLSELQSDKDRLDNMLTRYEKLITSKEDKLYSKEEGVVLSALKMAMNKFLAKMVETARKLKNLLKGKSAEYNKLEAQLKELMQMINEVEKPTVRKTTIGNIKVVDEQVYGTPVVEVGDKRIIAEKISAKTGKEVKQQTAINQVLNKLKEDTLAELKAELKAADKGTTSLGAKLLGRLLVTYPMQSKIHDIIQRTGDSVFGKVKGNTFANPKLLLDILPDGFKEFFAAGNGSSELLEDFKVMEKYLDNTEVGKIKITKDRKIYNTDYSKSNIDNYGLIMKTVTRKSDGKEFNMPVDIIELIGTEVNGELQLDNQTENILKFYSAKMLVDTQRMVGLILSMDESEMGQVLGVYDAEEQMQIKQDAREGFINSASVRADIGKEVYQALGIKFNKTTPEFTEESFIAALGVLVQAIAVENGSMEMKSGTSDTNRNLLKTNWDTIPVERNELIRAMAKLQYMNENRSRPLPSTKKPADRDNRMVMNTSNPIDKKSNDFINKQEKIAYRISPKLDKWLAMNEQDALKAMGYIDVNTAELHTSEIDATLARNDKLVREWNILKSFANGIGNKKFYLNWGQTVSGRFTILNDINYQESKLHREFVVAEGSTVEVDPKSEDDRQMLEASILQGLDMDPDKLSTETASAKFNRLFKVTDKGIEVTEDGAIKDAYDAMKNGEFNADAMAEVFAESEGHHGLSAIELLVEWDSAIRTGEKIRTHANLEIDAITSGMILTLLQIGSDEAIRLAEKGGIYTREGKEAREQYVHKWLGDGVEFTPGALIEAGKKHATELESQIKEAQNKGNSKELARLRKELEDDKVFKDLYSTIGVAMIGEVQMYKEKLLAKEDKSSEELQQLAMLNQIGELNLKNIRSIAKSPVMVFIYGATINSIKKKLTYSLGVDTLVKAMKTASKLLRAGKDAKVELEFIKQFEPRKGWTYTDGLGHTIEVPKEQWNQLLHMEITDEVISTLDNTIRATFGTAIENAFESKLGFVNRNRDAIKSVEILMFEAYQIRLSEEINKLLDTKYGKGKHKRKSYVISKNELQDINAQLTAQGYGHNIVWREGDEVVNQTLNKTGSKGGDNSVKVQVGEVQVGGQIKEAKPAVNTGAAPTISIHAIDGRMMLDTLNRDVKGYTGGNVYDAVVLSLDKAMLNDTANTYNNNMIETGFGRSILADQLAVLENMLATMTNSQKKQMLANIGLRPEGVLSEDYTKETNRLKLSVGKMLELLEIAEEVNKERLANSANEYHVGHLYQMGSGVTEVKAGEVRAKELPTISTIKNLLSKRLELDKEVTQKEFADKGVKLHPNTSHVLNISDLITGSTNIKSKANVITAGISKKTDRPTVTSKLTSGLSKHDVVELISGDKEGEVSRYWRGVLVNELLKSNAGLVVNDELIAEEALVKHDRKLVNGVWIKTVEGQTKAETKVKDATIGKNKDIVNALTTALNSALVDSVGAKNLQTALNKILDKIKDC